MPTLKLTLPRLHDGQAQIVRESRRFNAVCCGRRYGKSVLGIDRLIGPALEGWPVAYFCPSYRMLTEVWREVTQTLQPVTKRVNASEHRIELITGGVVDMWSLAEPNTARGRKYKRVVIDEAAMIRQLGEAWQAVIRATLADYEGDLFALSTPKGRNFFAQMFDWGQDPLMPDWASWQMPTATNPYIKPGEIEAMRAMLPERIFAQEVLAQFLEDAGGVFRGVMAAAMSTEQQQPIAGHQYVAGVDWGKQHDFTAVSVLDATTRQQVYLDRFNQIDYEVQRGRLKAIHERYRLASIIAERNSIGEPIIEQLQREGLPVQGFTTTNATKAGIVEALALAFERQSIGILPDAVQIAELQAYEMERLPSGMVRYSAPEGLHDDTVMALSLAWYAADHGLGTVTRNPFYTETIPTKKSIWGDQPW